MCVLNYIIDWNICSFQGNTTKSSMDNSSTIQYASQIQQLTHKATATVRDLDPTNDLTFLRIRSKKNEILVSPGSGK